MEFASMFEKAPWNVKIRTLRALKGLTIEEAAELCGTSKRVFNNWELAKFKPIKAFRRNLSKVFEVPEEAIFGEEDV